VEYTQNQINEITTEYGKVDILWLDGCWVMPKSKITKKVEEFCKYPFDMDINMKLIAEKARKSNPGMLVVDRWVFGEYENYLTPEQKTMDKASTVPWESCITMGGAWGWVPGDNYKSTRELVQLLVGIVAKGGNLLLGVGPKGTGEYEPAVYDRLAGMGKWLNANGEAIYETVPVEPFQVGKIAYTAKGQNTVYAIYMPAKDEASLPENLIIKTSLKGKLNVSLLADKKALKSKMTPDGLVVDIPQSMRESLAKQEAVVVKISTGK
jgi:alpha-L-fucosidase